MSSVAQPELALRLPKPAIDTADVDLLVRVLRSAGDWLTARQIGATMGLRATTSTERRVRAIAAAAAPRVVSFPGAPGYKLWDHCSVAEIDHCIAAFESQGRDMLKRAVLYRLAYHRRFRCLNAS